MITFLLLSRPTRLADKMKEEILRRAQHQVFFEKTAKAALNRMNTQSVDCLILNLDRFSFPQVRLIDQIRGLKFKFQILVFADEVNVVATELVKTMPGVLIFGKAFLNLDKDFLGLCMRFIKTAGSVQRKATRHPTFQRAKVENHRTGTKFTVLASNMSKGGGQIEFSNGTLSVGDEMTLTIDLPRMDKTHMIYAKSMWVRSSASGKRTAGLKFLRQEKTPARGGG